MVSLRAGTRTDPDALDGAEWTGDIAACHPAVTRWPAR